MCVQTSRFANMRAQIKQITSHFQPLEAVDSGSETQPQVVEKLNNLTLQNKG